MKIAIFSYQLFLYYEFLNFYRSLNAFAYIINIHTNKCTHVKLNAMHTLYFLLFIANDEKGGVTYKYKHRVTNNHEIECFNSNHGLLQKKLGI